MKKNMRLFAFIVLTLSAAISFADTESVARKMGIFITFTGNITEDEKKLLSETLLVKISELETLSVIEPIQKLQREVTYGEKQATAEALGADCYLTVVINGGKDEVKYTYLSFDILNGKLAIEEKTIERERELRSLHQSFWLSLVSDLGANYSSISGNVTVKEIKKLTGAESVVEKEKGIKVVIVAQPGTEINGIAATRVIVDDDGLASVELAQSATYELYATCAGYYPVRKQFYVGNEPLRVELDQNEGSRFAVDAYLHQADYLGAGFRYYLTPNLHFLDVKMTLYLWKLIWPTEYNRSAYEAPLVHLALFIGLYTNEADAFVRYSLSYGCFFRFSYTEALGIALDPISRFGLTPASFNVEISTFEKIRFFFEYNLNLYFTPNGDLFKLSMTGGNTGDDNTPGYVFGGHWVLDFLDFKIGVRFQL